MSKLNQIKCIILFLFISSILILPCNGSDTQFYNIPIHQFTISNVSPYQYHPGELKTINVTIKNIRKNSVFEIASSVPPDSGPIKIRKQLKKQHSGELYSNQEYTFQYELYIEENTPKGVYNLPVTVLWTAVKGGVVQKQEDLNVGIEVVESTEDIKIDITDVILPTEIKAGDNFTIKFRIKNVGETKVRALRANLPLFIPFISIGEDTEIFIPSLETNETAEIKYNLHVDKQAISRVYNLNFTLSYRDQIDRYISKTSAFGINIEESPTVYIQDIILEPTTLTPETEGLLMIQLINTGTNPIKDIKVEIYGGDELLTQTHNFIGQIDPQRSETTVFGIYVDPEARPGNYGLNIQITYHSAAGGKSFSNIYFTKVIPSSSLISLLIPEEVYDIIIAFLAFSISSYIIFIITGSRIARSRENKR